MNTISSLNHITAEDIKSITNSGVYSRGLSYCKNGHVCNLKSDERSPSVFGKSIENNRYNIELSAPVIRTNLYKITLVPYLHADINNPGCIELSPVSKLKGPNKNNQTFFAKNLI